jgi:hypothetical protein
LDAFVTFYYTQFRLVRALCLNIRFSYCKTPTEPSPTVANREYEVGKFQKAVTPKVFEVRSPYQKPVISYCTPGFYRAI